MYVEVSSKIALLLEGFVTNGALEWLLISVHNEVAGESNPCLEGFFTFIALVWWLTVSVCYK